MYTRRTLRTSGQRCGAAQQCCSSGTGWLSGAGIRQQASLPFGVLPHGNYRVGCSRAEALACMTRLWVWYSEWLSRQLWGTVGWATLQPWFSSLTPVTHWNCRWSHPLDNLYRLNYRWCGVWARVDLDGLLSFPTRGRQKDTKKAFTYAGNMNIVMKPK